MISIHKKPGIDVTLREYVEIQILSLKETAQRAHDAEVERAAAYRTQSELVAAAIAQRFSAIDKATTLAAEANSIRLEHMNEWRSEYESQRSTFITRTEIEDKLKVRIQAETALETRTQSLEKSTSNIEGKIWSIGVGFTVLTTLISLGLHFIH